MDFLLFTFNQNNRSCSPEYARRIAEEEIADDKPLHPESMDAELLLTVQQIVRQISLNEAKIADDRVDEIRKEAGQRIRAAESTMEKRLQDTALLEHRATSAEQELALLRNKIEENQQESRETIKGLNTENLMYRESNATLKQVQNDLERLNTIHTSEIQRLQQVIEADSIAEKAIARELQEAQVANQHTLTEMEQSNASLSEKHNDLLKQMTEHDSAFEALNGQYQAMQKRLDLATERRETALENLQESKVMLSTYQQTVTKLSGEYEAEKRAHKSSVTHFERLIKDKSSLISDLQTTLSSVTNRTDL